MPPRRPRNGCLISALLLSLPLLVADAGVAQARHDAFLREIRAASKPDAAPLALYNLTQRDEYATSVHDAAKRGDDNELIELYKAAHPEVWPRTVPGTPVLVWAALHGDAESVLLLLKRGADPLSANVEGWTALHTGAESNRPDVVRALLAAGADVNARTIRFGETPLMFSAGRFTSRPAVEIVRLLLAHGANPNAQEHDGETALMYAANRGDVETVRLLLAKNADARLKDNRGRTARERIEEFSHPDAISGKDNQGIPVVKEALRNALYQSGKLPWGRWINDEAQHRAEWQALQDFQTIGCLLQTAETTKRPGTKQPGTKPPLPHATNRR